MKYNHDLNSSSLAMEKESASIPNNSQYHKKYNVSIRGGGCKDEFRRGKMGIFILLKATKCPF